MITEDSIKLYKNSSILFYIDEYKGTILHIRDVPVLTEERKQIGFASIERLTNTLVAHITIDYHTQERFLAETRDIPIWARPVGKISREDKYIEMYPTRIIIDGVMLTTEQPSDRRLAPFGELLLI